MELICVTTLPDAPTRPSTGHKGTFGKVLIVAGSRGMSGAAALTGWGALRGGTGLVTVATPTEVASIVAGIEPSLLTWPLAGDAAGHIQLTSRDELLARIAQMDALAVGPGLGQSTELRQLIPQLVSKSNVPLVLDADGLNALVGQTDCLARRSAPCVITPHAGEFARLTGQTTSIDASQRIEYASQFARRMGVTVVLKGAATIVTDGTRYYCNTTGNSGMATAGSGDVLTGVIAALLGQKMQPWDAARLAVWLHGRAGDRAAEQLSEPGMIASDLPRFLGAAWIDLKESRGLPESQ